MTNFVSFLLLVMPIDRDYNISIVEYFGREKCGE